MAVTLARYTQFGTIAAVIDGFDFSVPDAPDNRHRQMIAEWEANGNAIAPYAPEPEPEPVPAITKAQALLYLLSIGKTEADVLAAIATITDPTERAVAEIEWSYRQPFRHDHPLFAALGPAVGITDMEEAFRAAAVF